MSEALPLVLASASPRRSDLLARAGVPFVVDPGDVDESLAPGIGPEDGAVELARRKALAVASRRNEPAELVLGADTIVALGERLLGKPADEHEAADMLRALSGSRHRVVTGVCLVRTSDGARLEAHERTWVTMRPLLEREVEAYVRSGEWRGKAGGYAIQESADAFVTRLEEGGFDNVVGLPVDLVLGLLARLSGPGTA